MFLNTLIAIWTHFSLLIIITFSVSKNHYSVNKQAWNSFFGDLLSFYPSLLSTYLWTNVSVDKFHMFLLCFQTEADFRSTLFLQGNSLSLWQIVKAQQPSTKEPHNGPFPRRCHLQQAVVERGERPQSSQPVLRWCTRTATTTHTFLHVSSIKWWFMRWLKTGREYNKRWCRPKQRVTFYLFSLWSPLM